MRSARVRWRTTSPMDATTPAVGVLSGDWPERFKRKCATQQNAGFGAAQAHRSGRGDFT